MLEKKFLEAVNQAEGEGAENADNDRDKDEMLSAATELCLIYLECEKIIKKHQQVLGSDFD